MSSKGSKLREDVGLTELEYERYLYHTRNVANSILRDLAKKNLRQNTKFSWQNVGLKEGNEAVARVNRLLVDEGVCEVDDGKIRGRLIAIKDLQRSSKNPSAEPTTASASTPDEDSGPYDPIRDV